MTVNDNGLWGVLIYNQVINLTLVANLAILTLGKGQKTDF